MSDMKPNRINRKFFLDAPTSFLSKLINDEELSCMYFTKLGAKWWTRCTFQGSVTKSLKSSLKRMEWVNSRYRLRILSSILSALQSDIFGFFIKQVVPAQVIVTDDRDNSHGALSFTEWGSSKNRSDEWIQSQRKTAHGTGMKTILKGRNKQPLF